MAAERPICVLVGALGGQGGGVLADWLVEAAHAAGYPAQATSIPGVAQRTGATTYYLEVYPEREPPREPVFSLFPSAGDVDLVAAMEPTEGGRALGRGFITDRTVVVTTARRVYSTAEKMIAGDGTVDPQSILGAMEAAAKRLIRLDGAQQNHAVNALVLGAIAGSGVLPLSADDFTRAIEARGVAAAANIAAFNAGMTACRAPETRTDGEVGLEYQAPPPGFAADVAALPQELQAIVGHGVARLVDYQGPRYARRYLARLVPVVDFDRATEGEGYRLSLEVAKRLAAWMSYEDVIRVAQLKTRPGRLARIRTEVGARPDEPLRLVDFLKPGRREIKAILPPALAGLLGESRAGQPAGRPLRLHTAAPWGYGLMRLLALLRPLRPASSGFAREQALIDRWLACVTRAAGHDYVLACKVAEVAVWARGYGEVRERGFCWLNELFRDWDTCLEAQPHALAERVESALHAARSDPEAACRAPAQQIR